MVPICLILFYGCSSVREKDGPIEQLLDVDTRFSDRSKEVGMNQAFLEFADEDAVLLRPNTDPIIGKDNMSNYLANNDDSKYTLTWQPLRAYASKSADMGYTFGTYTFTQDTIQLEGTYVSIWVKDETGQWKYSLDTGNPGLSD